MNILEGTYHSITQAALLFNLQNRIRLNDI
jgi:hypothetical protein